MARILVVDDDDSVARVVTHYLCKAGHTPVVAPDGAAALRAAGSHPDLILLDLGLPDMPGAAVLRQLKRDSATAAIPVVVISGDPDATALVAETGARAAAAILRKPVYFRELCDVVEAVLRGPAGWGEQDGPDAPKLRVQLLYRLITEGSNVLVRLVCLRLDADRAGRRGRATVQAPTWSEVARAGRQEGLLNGEEAALLAASPTVLAGRS